MVHRTIIDCIAIGRVCRQTIIPLNKRIYENMLAGPVLYVASGMRSLMDNIGIISAIPGSDHSEISSLLHKYAIDDTGIVTLGSSVKKQFFGYSTVDSKPFESPIPFFSSMHMKLSASLLSDGYIENQETAASAYYPSELRQVYLNASAAHLCADELEHQLKASTLLDKTAISVLTLMSNPKYMTHSSWESVMTLMNGLTAFITTSYELVSLFKNRTDNLNEISRVLQAHGCEYLVLIKNSEGFELVDLSKHKRYQIPHYPAEIIDPTGMSEVFCGALLAELRRSHDPLRAVTYGSVLSSIKGEGCGPFYVLESLPGLIEARVDRMKDWIKYSPM